MQTGNASRIATSLQGDLFRAALYLLPGLILLQSAAVLRAEGRNWALLIGVGNYQDTNVLPLPFAQRDVEELQTALVQHGLNWESERVVMLVDSTAERLRREIREFLQRPQQDDQIIVYFTGHGFRGGDGRVYLAPVDFKPEPAAEIEKTGIDVSWLRERLAECAAASKIVIIDSCHAGARQNFASVDDIRTEIDKLERVITLASCTEDEKSIVWPEKKQSLFSYWLTQALKGHADKNMDGEVKFDDVYTFVHSKVMTTASKLPGSLQQTPVRRIGLGVKGSPVLTVLKPQPLDDVISDMAQQIAWAIQSEGLTPVGMVPEFHTWDPRVQEATLKSGDGTLGQRLASDLRTHLDELSQVTNDFTVVSFNEFKSILEKRGIGPREIDGTHQMHAIINDLPEARAKGQLVQVHGSFDVLQGSTVRLVAAAKSIGSGRPRTIIETAGTAILSLDTAFGEAGKGVVLQDADFKPLVHPDLGELPREQSAVERLLAAGAQQVHPHLNAACPFRVGIVVWNPRTRRWEERETYYTQGQAVVGLDRGEIYRIRVAYNDNKNAGFDTSKPVHVKILVDGISVRDDSNKFKGLTQQALDTKGVEFVESAAVSNLGGASAYVLDATEPRYWVCRGYEVDRDHYCPFTVVDAPESLAAERGFGDQAGVIMVAFYSDDQSVSRGVGTKPGTVVQGTAFRPVQNVGRPGEPLAYVPILYVSRAGLTRMKQQLPPD